MAVTIIYTEEIADATYTDEEPAVTVYLDECEWKTQQQPDGQPLEDDIDQ